MGRVQYTPTLVIGEQTVTTGLTAVQVSTAEIRVKSATIRGKAANTDPVYLGPSTVMATLSNDGINAGDAIHLPALNWLDLSALYINSTADAQGIDFEGVRA